MIALLILMALLAAGCVQTGNAKFLNITMDIPQSVFSDQEFSAYIDISNEGNRTYTNVQADFFNTGAFDKKNSCSLGSRTMRPLDWAIIDCRLKYNRFIERDVTERVDVRIRYDNNYNFGITLLGMSEKKYEERRITGTLESLPRTFSFSNEEISADIELSENPVVDRNDNENYAYFTIRNSGSGFIENINGGDVKITSVPAGMVTDCDAPSLLFHDNGVFPKITCKLARSSEPYQNIYIFLNIDYNYELRRSGTILVKK